MLRLLVLMLRRIGIEQMKENVIAITINNGRNILFSFSYFYKDWVSIINHWTRIEESIR